MKKKLLTILLSVFMMMGTFTTRVFAENEQPGEIGYTFFTDSNFSNPNETSGDYGFYVTNINPYEVKIQQYSRTVELTIPSTVSDGTYTYAIVETSGTITDSNLKKLTFSEGLRVISNGLITWTASSLEELNLPSTITSIGDYAFAGCSNLKNITIKATIPPTLYSDSFFSSNSIEHIYVPASSVASYKSAENWSAYASKIEAIPVTIADILPNDFPNSAQNGWINGIGTKVYASLGNLIFEDVDLNVLDSISLETELEPFNGGYYKYTNGKRTYEIATVNGKAIEFTLSGEGFDEIPEIRGLYEKHKSGTTVLDVLLTNSNFHSYDVVPWSNANGKVINIAPRDVSVFFGFVELTFGIETTELLSQKGDNYTIEFSDVTFEFVMNNGVLTSVIVDGIEELEPSMAVYDGEYTAPVIIADILPKDFPNANEFGWVKENSSTSNRIYIDGDNLKIGTSPFPLNGVVIKDGNNYKYTSGMVFVNFIMESDVLNKINFIVMSATASGDYVPYKYEIEPTESKPEGYTGNLVFKTNGQYTNDSDVIVKIDGTPITLNKDYIVENGSVKVTLLGDYIKNLAPKTYTISIGVTGEKPYGEITSEFTITATSSPKPKYVIPNTGVE